MAVVLTPKKKLQARILKAENSTSLVGLNTQLIRDDDLSTSIKKFNQFWDLMDTVRMHGYMRAAMSVVGRSAVGAWWKLRKHEEWGDKANDRQRKKLYKFYMEQPRNWTNIKDFQNLAYKILIGTQYLRFFGQVAYEILRDGETGAAVGFDHLPGLVVPNIDDNGNFKTPAFIQYPSRNPMDKVYFDSPNDVIYIINPDWEGSPIGGSDIEALTSFNLPLDIYLQTAAREYMKNRDKPEVVYELSKDIDEEAFESFVNELNARHRGAKNMGRSAIALQGEFKIHELKPLPSSLPYQESRKDNRDEELAVAGVSGAKMGISDNLSSANLRELRREFHETNMVPLFRLMEFAFYEQVHVREFKSPGWEMKFNNPSFLNAVEQATVHMRYKDMEVLSPNEIRYQIGLPPREGGDEYGRSGSGNNPSSSNQGSPPEGREDRPDSPSETGEPTLDDQDPPRGDQHDEEPRERVMKELRLWRSFALRRKKKGKDIREFNSDILPESVREIIHSYLNQANTIEEIADVFDEAIEEINNLYEEGVSI